ncbi:MAG: Ig-like domain-containing protein, partial [Pseudomonadota bacterium]
MVDTVDELRTGTGELELVLAITRETLVELIAVAQQLSGRFSLSDGELVYTYDEKTLRLAGSEELFSDLRVPIDAVLDLLNSDPAALLVLADSSQLVPLGTLDPAFRDVVMAAVLESDGIERGAAAATDTLRGHLDGIESPSLYFSVNLEQRTFANLFARVDAGVGSDIGHLPPLPDEDYVRGFDPTVFRVLDPDQPATPPTATDSSFSASEDQTITGDLSANDTLPNAGAIYALKGTPPQGGQLTINDDGTFTFVPNDGFAGEVTFTYTITDPAAGTTVEGEATLNITPVVDAPSIVPDLPVLTCQEDVPVSFSPVSINLEDTDGSETLSIRIEGVPAGASLSAGTQVSPGVWQVDPADFPTLTLTPPNDFNGSINLELIATSVETSTGETATTRRDLRIDLAAVADPAQVSAPTVTTNEDTQVNFGSSVTYNADDADGSEFVDMVAVTGVPAGANLSYTAQGAAIITVLPTGISIQGTEADIRATMNTLAITPGSQSGDDFTLQVAVTTRDAGGATNTITAGQTINVVPVADAPNATGGTFNTNEDTTVNLSGMSAGLVDVDGSETLSIVLSGVPAGATLNGGTALGGGRFALTPAELAALQFTPPANAHGTYSLSLEATATEAEGDTETTTVPVTINVAAQADAPNLTVGTTTTNEDVAAPFGTAIGFGLVDGDGSESVTSVRLTSVPANVTLNYSAAPGATVTAISGGFEITGTQAAIRTTLDSFTASNPTHGAIHFGIHVAVTTTDAGGSTATSNGTHQIDITPVADAPTVSSATTNVNEDTNVVFGDEITYSLVDADGSEAVTQVVVTGIPASATASYTATGGATVTAVSGGYQITGSPTAIRSTLDTLALTPGTNDDSDITLSVAVTTTDSNGDTATTNSSHTLAVSAVADAPTGSGSGSGTEDTTISTPVTIGLSDNDGSETIAQFQITAPTGATLDGFGPSGATVNNAGSVWTVTGTQTQITQALAAMTVTPPANSDVDFNLSVAITATETSPNGGQVATFSNTTTISVPVTLTADADAPTMTGGSFSTEEDTPVALSTLNVALADTDGSETITQIRITGVPTGASLSAGTQVSPGIWELSSAQLATVQFNPPANSHGTYNMTLSAITTEGSNSDTASASVPFSVTVDAQVDAATVTGGSTSTNEDVDVQFGNQISYTLGDTDGSENVTQVDITGLAGDVDMSYTAAGAAVVSSISGGYRITGTPTEIRATLNSFTYSPATHVGDDVNLTVDVTVEDADGSTRVDTATHVINVTPVVDTPSATGGTFGTNEDTAVPLTGIGGTLADTDGSEVATFSLSNVPAGASFATGTDAGGGVWTFTAAQMAAGLSFTPPAGASGTFDMTLTMTSTETGGTTATDTANVRVNVTGVADPATVTTGTTNATEDSNIPFGADITISGNDPDGSESFSVTLSGIPSAATAFWNNTLPGTVTANGGGSWTIAGTEAQVQALLASFGVTPDTHAASNFTVNVAVTTSEGTSTNTVNQNHIINFAQVADAPTVNAGTTTISEDVAGVFGTGITYALVDTDGSETISEVRVTGVPSGASISYTASGSASVTAVSGGYSITGTEAGIRATLNTFAYTTDTHDDAEVQLTVAVTSRDANGDTATTSSTHDLVVEARADEATITGSGSGNEDTTIAAGVTATLIDNDGSETITQAVVTAPAGITVSGFGPSGATVNQSGQQWTITGTPAEISAALAAMTATPPANSDANF